MIPRDVEIRWNYTYEMLSFAYVYREPYNELTSNRDMKMRSYELEDNEWEIVNQLAKVLKVRIFSFLSTKHQTKINLADFQRRHPLLFPLNSKPCQGHPCHGPYRPASCYIRNEGCSSSLHQSGTRSWQAPPQQILLIHRSFRTLSDING